VRRVLVALVALTALLIGGAAVAAAHPLGNFTVNSYLRVEASGGELYLRQVVDMAEIPTFRERSAIDEAGGLQPYAAARARERAAEIELAVDGRRVAVEPVSQTAEVRPGQGGLRVLRYAAWYRAPGAASVARDGGRVDVSVPAYRDRLGWHELVVRPSSGAGVAGATVAERDVSDELRSYPEDRLSSPLTVTEASFTWSPGTGAGEVGPLTADPESRVEEDAPGGLAGLVDDDLSVGVVLLALVLAMGWGALHSLSPGHGKTMVAGYLVGSRGRPKDAALLGLTVTITHTSAVFALGLITLAASAYVLPEDLYPWLGVASGAMVIAIGLWAIWTRLRRWRAMRAEHDHGHHHMHAHTGHSHTHSHAAPGAPITTRSLIALGVSGGIVPCPSALVVLVAAISQHRLGLGLVLILAFSIGLAATLTAVGLAVLHGGRLIQRLRPERRLFGGRVAGVLPALSATLIVVAGSLITLRAIPQIG
jgi:ABC-type nickel/cobalt efflux system permease component RcnA